jgi:YD repeat-containing protein
VALNDTSYFTFDYTNSLQVSQIKNYFGAVERNATAFTYETPAGDVPRLTSSSVSAQNWSGVNGVPAQITTQYSVAGDGACVLTAPDGTVYKEYYGTGWQKGLTTLSEIWSGGVKQKWTTTAWTQDNTAVSYETNPRVTETNVYDASGNRRRTVIDWGGNPQYVQYGLPYGVREFAADGVTEVRQTWTDYNLSQAYLDRRIIGLVSQVHLTNVSSWQGKITYEYDDPARLSALPAAATQHDSAYNTSFTLRGNVTSVSQWDSTDIANTAKKLTSYTDYFVTGTPASATDPSTHTSTISYTDAFSDGLNNRNTFAYPTMMTDADGYSSTVQYNFDFGATTRTQSPAPASQSQGLIRTMAFNNLGQLERVTTLNTGAYKRFWHGPNYVASYASVNNVADELYAIQVVDGLGRVIGAAGNHPNSNGGYRLVVTVYDQMGRATNVSNPTEVNNSWVASGEDAAGIYYTQQTYDWKGRPLVTTNPDSTTKTVSYSGCGCAGGEVVTVTDQGTIDGGVAKRRQQKIYSDVLERTVKTEVLNWQGGSVYATTVNTYNVRDQLTQARQYAGAEANGSFQDTTFTYDGYARLKTRHRPEQQVDSTNSYSTDHTTWNYNPDDTVQVVTDARGASQNFSYNGRHLVTAISYAAPSGITTIAPVQPVAYSYDAAGNRTLMTDGNGHTNYTYDELSQMRSETRQFNGVTGNYALNYDYNLAGELKTITDPTGATINYGYDALGRVANVSGSAYGGVTQYASAFAYRAWGAIKGFTYGNNLTASMSYNARLKSTQFEVAGRPPQYGSSSVMKTQYQYYDDGALKYADDLLDNRFDRAYNYDQLTRLKEDYSGSEASDFANQTSSGTTTGPYRQSYSYDAWSNFTSRTGRFWSKPTTFTASYSNGRNTNSLWQHDADGRVLRESMLKYTFDAAGRNVTTSSVLVNQFVGGEVTQTRDGDGLEIKREETRQGATTTGYRLRSSVLGGQVVTELNATGQKQKSYVYLGGERLAEQAGGSVTWKHTNPLTGSEGSSYASGLYTPEKELDPTLVDVGFQDPYINFEEPQPDSLQLLGGNSNGQCTIEGMSWDCTSAYRLTELGVADEVVPTTVYAIYGDGRMKPVWSGLARPDPLGRAVSSSPAGSGSTGAAGSNGHAPDTSTAVLAGTDNSSVTVTAGADYVSTGPQNLALYVGQTSRRSTTTDECKTHRAILMGRHSAALEDAWNRSQFGTSAAHEEGGLLGSAIDDGEPYQKDRRVNANFTPSGAGPRAALLGFKNWAYSQLRADKNTVSYDYWYHTHPFVQGDRDPVTNDEIGDSNQASYADTRVSVDLGLRGVLITKTSIIVYDFSGNTICEFARRRK